MRRSLSTIILLAASFGVAYATPAHAQEQAPQAEPAPDSPPVVELVEAGTDPQVRRYQFNEGDTVMLRMVADIQMQMDTGMGFQGATLPKNEQFMSMNVRSVDDDGLAQIDAAIERIGIVPDEAVDPFVADAYLQGLVAMRGMRIRHSMDPLGHIDDVFATMPDGTPIADRQMRALMEDTAASASVPLPEAAIGVGGRWRVIEDVEINGVRMERTSTHTLNAIEDGMLHIASTVEVDMEPHDVENPDLPPGTRLRMESTTMTGSGTSAFKLDTLQGHVEITTKGDIHMTIFQDGVPMKMAQRISMSIKIEPYEGDLPEIEQGSDDAPPF